jgi:hypothetical protein
LTLGKITEQKERTPRSSWRVWYKSEVDRPENVCDYK